MALVEAVPVKNHLLFLSLLLIWINALTFSQGRQNWKNHYPFIKQASTFSASSSTSSSGGRKAYDYIIVGGGTAGCPLAATLSRNFSVLLLERGGVPFANFNVSHLKNFHISLADTSPGSAAQTFISTDGVFNSRARVLGGGSCINAGFYTRASTRYLLLPSLFNYISRLMSSTPLKAMGKNATSTPAGTRDRIPVGGTVGLRRAIHTAPLTGSAARALIAKSVYEGRRGMLAPWPLISLDDILL